MSTGILGDSRVTMGSNLGIGAQPKEALCTVANTNTRACTNKRNGVQKPYL